MPAFGTPNVVPPPAPLAPPPAPVAPAPPPVLTVGEKARHVAWFLGSWAGAFLLFYVGGWVWPYVSVLLGCALGVLGLLCAFSGLWALLPFYAEWQTIRAYRAYQQDVAYQGQRGWQLTEYGQLAYIDAYLRPKTRQEPPLVINTGGARVAGVDTPPATPPPTPAPVREWVTTQMARVETMVNAALSDEDEEAEPEPEHPTTRLPELPPAPAWRAHPAQAYTAELRTLVSLAAETGTCDEKAAKAAGINRRAWQRGCDTLAAVGVLSHDPGQPWTLSDRARRFWYDNGDDGLHEWVRIRLAKGV